MMESHAQTENLIEVQDLKNYLGDRWVHNGLNFSVKRGEIIAIIGGSGCGKTTLLNSILMLLKPTSGRVKVFNQELIGCSPDVAMEVRKRWGVMFQSGALFSSLSVLENVMFPMQEFAHLPRDMRERLACYKIGLAGLELDAANKFPAELSGGMKKRAALARAIAVDAELLFLDEPTAGLDPKSAGAMDELVLHLRASLGLTFVMVTHDLDTLWTVPDRVIFLGDGKVLAATSMEEMVQQTHPLIRDYFSGLRAQTRQSDITGAQDGV